MLQVNSGFNKNIISDNKKEIFEISMLNINMMKRRLKDLLPILISTIKHPTIASKRGTTCKKKKKYVHI